MGLYFSPPQPVQAATHAPIAAQGQQPPPYRSIAAVMVAASLAWTPAPAPAQEPSLVAPLIPAPAAGGPTPISSTLFQAIRAIWDSQPSWNSQHAATIAPLTLIYGQQPPLWDGAATMANVLATPPLTWSAQDAPPNAGWNFIPPAVNQPTPVSIAALMAIRSVWPVEAWSTQRAPWLAPLTLTYGQQPPAYSIAPQVGIRAAWDVQPWVAQSEFDNAGWNASAVLPTQVPPASAAVLASIIASWQAASWSAQSEIDNAGWNFSPAIQNPPPRVQISAAQLATVWSVQWSAQRAQAVAGIIPPPVVNNPPLISGVNRRLIVDQWAQSWTAQRSILSIPPYVAPIPPVQFVTPAREMTALESGRLIISVNGTRLSVTRSIKRLIS